MTDNTADDSAQTPKQSWVKRAAHKFQQDVARGYNASQTGGVLGPDKAEREVQKFFTDRDGDHWQYRSSQKTDRHRSKTPHHTNFHSNHIARVRDIPHLASFRDPHGQVFTYDTKRHLWVSGDKKYTLSARQGASAFNRSSEKSNINTSESRLEQNRSLTQGLRELADLAESDKDLDMAKSELYKLSKYSMKLHDMLKDSSKGKELESWQQAKITKAADYISSVYHSLDYNTKFSESVSNDDDTDASTLSDDPKFRAGAKLIGHLTGMEGSESLMIRALEKLAQGEQVPAHLSKHVSPIIQQFIKIIKNQESRSELMHMISQHHRHNLLEPPSTKRDSSDIHASKDEKSAHKKLHKLSHDRSSIKDKLQTSLNKKMKK